MVQYLLHLVPLLFLSAQSFAATTITAGPLATISLKDRADYKTGRSCAVGCLVYNGLWNPSVAGFYDLGVEIACGRTSRANGCYCATTMSTEVTSYINSCVRKKCEQLEEGKLGNEVTSVIELYNGYCAGVATEPMMGLTTAKVGSVGTKTTTGIPASAEAKATDAPSSGGEGGDGDNSEASNSREDDGKGEKKGLSQSDIIALGTGLGVGVPSLIVAIVTCWMQMRKRKNRLAAQESDVLDGKEEND
jgi:hypothetical protein